MRREERGRGYLLILCWLAAFAIRATFVGTTPLLPDLRRDFGLTYGAAGLLASLPVLFWGVAAIPAAGWARRWGGHVTLAVGLLLLTLGAALRSVALLSPSLFLWTVIMGVGGGLIQPLLPVVVKEHFPERPGTATGIYTSGLLFGATVAAALTLPLLERLGGWRPVTLIWSLLPLLAFLLWVVRRRAFSPADTTAAIDLAGLLRDPIAWRAGLLFTLQSNLYYALVAWIPSLSRDQGRNPDETALLFTLFNLATALTALLVPSLSDRLGRRRPFLIGAAVGTVLGFSGLIGWPAGAPAWLFLLAYGLATLFVLSLALPVDAVESSRLAAAVGLILTIGYGGAFVGPFLIGLARDLTRSFTAGLFLALLLAALTLWVALRLPETGRGRGAGF